MERGDFFVERDLISIKGTRNGLVIVLKPSREFEELKNNLLRKMESAKGFFKGAKFTFLQDQKHLPEEQMEELKEICLSFGMVPSMEIYSQKPVLPLEKTHQKGPYVAYTPAGAEPAVLVKKTLRSGQAVHHKHHIIIIGDVNPGAEIISGGSVIVLGNCLGAVHAGVGGNVSAIVAAIELRPALLTIAGLRYIKNEERKGPLVGFCIARLDEQQIKFQEHV